MNFLANEIKILELPWRAIEEGIWERFRDMGMLDLYFFFFLDLYF